MREQIFSGTQNVSPLDWNNIGRKVRLFAGWVAERAVITRCWRRVERNVDAVLGTNVVRTSPLPFADVGILARRFWNKRQMGRS